MPTAENNRETKDRLLLWSSRAAMTGCVLGGTSFCLLPALIMSLASTDFEISGLLAGMIPGMFGALIGLIASCIRIPFVAGIAGGLLSGVSLSIFTVPVVLISTRVGATRSDHALFGWTILWYVLSVVAGVIASTAGSTKHDFPWPTREVG